MALFSKKPSKHELAHDFLSDADEIERQPLPRLARSTIHFMALGLLIAILVATFSEVDMIVTAKGKLITPLPNIVMQPLENSIVERINVRPGQVVKKGDELAILDSTFTEADRTQLQNKLDSLVNQRQFLEAELLGKTLPTQQQASSDQQIQNRLSNERQASYQAQLSRLDENIGRIKAALETNRKDLSSLASRVQVQRELVDMQEKLLADKLITRSRVLEAQDRLLEAERSAQMAKSRSVELQKELMALEAERQTFKSGWRQKVMEDLLSISREIDAVNEELQKADKRSRMVTMTAPVDAVVQDVAKLSPGSIARGTEPFLTLVPLGEVLEAEVKINAPDIGYVRKDAITHVKLDAYPFQLHGTAEGILYVVSEDAYKHDPPMPGSAESYYAGRVRLNDMSRLKLPPQARLLPGMSVSAEITVGKRSVMTFILWPLMKALREAAREP